MKFVTGSKTAPTLGLPGKLEILFKHECKSVKTCKCKLKVSTCDLSMTIPVHYKNSDDMFKALAESMEMSCGFDEL